MKISQILPNRDCLYDVELLLAELYSYNKAGVLFRTFKKNDGKSDLCHYHSMPLPADNTPGGIISLHDNITASDLGTLKKFSLIFCNSKAQQQFLRQNGVANTRFLPYGIDKRKFDVKRTASAKTRIGIFSRAGSAHNVEGQLNYLLSLFKEMDTECYSFSIAGVNMETIHAALSFLGYECELHNYLPVNLIPAFFAGIDAIVHLEGFAEGMNLAAAVWTGTPFISKGNHVLPEYFSKEQGILLSGDKESDIAQIDGILVPGNIRKLRESIIAGRDKIMSWEEYSEIVYNEYKTGALNAAA